MMIESTRIYRMATASFDSATALAATAMYAAAAVYAAATTDSTVADGVQVT